jgi:hypothetical protein
MTRPRPEPLERDQRSPCRLCTATIAAAFGRVTALGGDRRPALERRRRKGMRDSLLDAIGAALDPRAARRSRPLRIALGLGGLADAQHCRRRAEESLQRPTSASGPIASAIVSTRARGDRRATRRRARRRRTRR